MPGPASQWASFKDAAAHLLYVACYFSLIGLVAVVFDIVGHRVLPWIGVTSFVGSGFVWAAEALFAIDLLLLAAFVGRSVWDKLRGE